MIPISKPATGKEELELLKKVLASAWLGQGSYVLEFESLIGEFLNGREIVAVNSGTAALHLALEAVGIQKEDEVIVPSMTFCATVQAITALGAKPVFCDVVPSDLNMDIDKIEELISDSTRAIIPVHFLGNPCNLEEILKIGSDNNLTIIEDAAHAFGSSYRGKKIGSFGDITCFSFDPIKNITCGEGGAVSLSNSELATIIRRKRNLGIDRDTWYRQSKNLDWYYEVSSQGYRYHMSNVNAAIGIAQFRKMEEFYAKKMVLLNRYNEAFQSIDGICVLDWDTDSVFPFAYVMRVLNNRRNDLMNYLKLNGIDSGINYIPNHLQPFFNNDISLPVTEKLFEEIITIPFFVDMTERDQDIVIEKIQTFFR